MKRVDPRTLLSDLSSVQRLVSAHAPSMQFAQSRAEVSNSTMVLDSIFPAIVFQEVGTIRRSRAGERQNPSPTPSTHAPPGQREHSFLDRQMAGQRKEIKMSARFQKTDAGRQEIGSKDIKLSRAQRTLLLIIDGSRPVAQWVQLIHGSKQEDIDNLLSRRLIEQVVRPATESIDQPKRSLESALATLDYNQLYGLLTGQAKERLGLFKGFMFVLEVEKCANEAELRQLAVRFVTLVGEVQGPRAAQTLQLALGVAM